jgi:hypothetical protein
MKNTELAVILENILKMLKDISDRLEKLESKHAIEYHFHSHTNVDTKPAIVPTPTPYPQPSPWPWSPIIWYESNSVGSNVKDCQVYNVAEISQ